MIQDRRETGSESITNETRLTRIQALVVEILNDLLRSPIDETDAAIHRAIARIGTYCQRDRSYVFVRSGIYARNTHEWCAAGIDPQIEQLQELPWEGYGPDLIALFEANEPLHVPDVAQLGDNPALQELLTMQSIVSVIMVPMLHEGALYGFMGFDGVHHTHAFLPGEIYLLRSVADVICTLLQRRESEIARRRAEAELATERAFMAGVLATSAVGIIVIDDQERVSYANAATGDLFPCALGSLVGMRHDDRAFRFERPDGSRFEPEEHPYHRVRCTGEPVANLRVRVPMGETTRYFSIHASPLRLGGGKADQVVYAVLDVTEQALAEQSREDALEEARRANAAKSNFLAKMSHEMRTPLNGVLGIAEVLEGIITNPDQRRMVKVMHDSGTLLLGIINDLLDMSKIEADLLEIEEVPFDAVDLAQRLEAVHTLKAAEKRLSFGVSLLGDAARPRLGDPYRLLQILHNLISNAVKFTEGGTVAVTIDCRSPDMMRFSVRDTGIGMTESQLGAVFEDFGQADSSIARRFGGTGLGMPIVRRLVDMMGGSIELHSSAGVGTHVAVDLPIGYSLDQELPQAAPIIRPAPRDLRGLRVLAADDNRTNRMILGAMLGQLGVTTVMVPDGLAALTAVDAEPFDAVILDISMPGMDGISVMQEMRRREREGLLPVLPILAFTANAMSHQVEAYLAAGFDDCLTKPLQLERLRQALTDGVAEIVPPRSPEPVDMARG